MGTRLIVYPICDLVAELSLTQPLWPDGGALTVQRANNHFCFLAHRVLRVYNTEDTRLLSKITDIPNCIRRRNSKVTSSRYTGHTKNFKKSKPRRNCRQNRNDHKLVTRVVVFSVNKTGHNGIADKWC